MTINVHRESNGIDIQLYKDKKGEHGSLSAWLVRRPKCLTQHWKYTLYQKLTVKHRHDKRQHIMKCTFIQILTTAQLRRQKPHQYMELPTTLGTGY